LTFLFSFFLIGSYATADWDGVSANIGSAIRTELNTSVEKRRVRHSRTNVAWKFPAVGILLPPNAAYCVAHRIVNATALKQCDHAAVFRSAAFSLAWAAITNGTAAGLARR
jgi:hypothetical protein